MRAALCERLEDGVVAVVLAAEVPESAHVGQSPGQPRREALEHALRGVVSLYQMSKQI